jgi:hypothetical protein
MDKFLTTMLASMADRRGLNLDIEHVGNTTE